MHTYVYIHIYIYIYIYIHLDFSGFDSRRLLVLRGVIPRSLGDLPEIQTLRFVVCGSLIFSSDSTAVLGAPQVADVPRDLRCQVGGLAGLAHPALIQSHLSKSTKVSQSHPQSHPKVIQK